MTLPPLPTPGKVLSEPLFYKDEWKRHEFYTAKQMRDYAAAAVAAERERAEAAEKDAARYRWLRNNPQWLGWEHDFRPDEVEREVDAAMASEPASPQSTRA